ncbi:MAG: HK97 family phage prohead protease, partial [Gammaproteobacteria bacterium]|nr:HK97 family phage prohead protease [Gammaproteobacteria bacterium]
RSTAREGDGMGATQMEYKTAPFEVTSLDVAGRTVEGYAAFFGNVDRVKDVIHPGAFRKTLAERGNKVKFLWQHAKEEPLGRILSLKEDDRGLFMQAAISDTTRGRDVLALLHDEALDALSIGYDAIPGGTEYTKSKDHGTVRELKELRLWEVSLVTFGANEMAQVTALKGHGPTEGKPAPDVTENTIRWRVREPGDFEADSFRTISIGAEDNGIQAVVGRLKGETTTTIQTYIFDRDKFDVGSARAWVDEHEQEAKQMMEDTAATGGDLVPPEGLCRCTQCDYEQAADSCDFECPECGAPMEAAPEPEDKAVDEEEGYAYRCAKCGHELVRPEDVYEGECPVCGGAMQRKEAAYQCECLECGHTLESAEHCRDVPCPECGGEMRRADRPGVGKGDEGAAEDKAGWSTAYINDLPDAAFLWIAPGGEKDDEGKTEPRNLRYFPYQDAAGTVDLPHLRNAIAQIPKAKHPALTAAKMKALQGRARGILEKAQGDKSAGAPDEAKAGRVLATRNAERIVTALQALIETLEDAGIDVPGFGEEPGPSDTAQMDEEDAEPQAAKQAGTAGGAEEPATPPTSKGLDDLALQVQVAQIELELLEV